jgi:hypothetical protein
LSKRIPVSIGFISRVDAAYIVCFTSLLKAETEISTRAVVKTAGMPGKSSGDTPIIVKKEPPADIFI